MNFKKTLLAASLALTSQLALADSYAPEYFEANPKAKGHTHEMMLVSPEQEAVMQGIQSRIQRDFGDYDADKAYVIDMMFFFQNRYSETLGMPRAIDRARNGR